MFVTLCTKLIFRKVERGRERKGRGERGRKRERQGGKGREIPLFV